MKLCIKKLFDNNNYTQQQLADEIGSTRQYISALCNGTAKKIYIEQIVKLCEIFKCTPNDLFEFSDSDKEKFKIEDPIKWCELQKAKSTVKKPKNNYVLVNSPKPGELHFNPCTIEEAKELLSSNEMQKAMEELMLSILTGNQKDDTE